MNDLEIFIVCHDQNIIVKNEVEKKFSNLKLYRYLFVGNGPIGLIENHPKVIICRNLLNNIEQYKYLVSFTAWYALAKNNLVITKYVSILEYDIDITPDFYKTNLETLTRTNGIIGYRIYPLFHSIYLGATTLLQFSLKQIYNIDIVDFLTKYVNTTGKNTWCSSSNCTLPTDIFLKFVDWFIPISEVIRSDKLGAHVHERVIKVFAILNDYKTFYLPNILKHWQDKSHKIEALI
jgi:hypothetical protein